MRTTLLVLLAATVLALTACGSGSQEGERSELDLSETRAQFIARSDELCKASNTRTRALNRELQLAAAGAPNDDALLRRLAPILQRGYGRVRDNAAALLAVNPPPADADRIERVRAAYDQQAELARKLASAAKRGEVQRFRELSEQQREVVIRARRLARDFGFKQCGSAKSDAR